MTDTSLLKTYADPEGAARAWARSVPSIAALVGTRVFFMIPDNTLWPLITVQQIGEGNATGDAPVDVAWLQFDCWAGPHPLKGKSNLGQASQVKAALKGAIESITAGTPMGDDARCLWARTLSSFRSPDPESNQARYVLTAEFAIAAT